MSFNHLYDVFCKARKLLLLLAFYLENDEYALIVIQLSFSFNANNMVGMFIDYVALKSNSVSLFHPLATRPPTRPDSF